MNSANTFIEAFEAMEQNSFNKNSILSKRELEILQLMAEGLNHKAAAEKLFISPKTVRTHLQNIYAKLNVKNKIEAINKVKLN